MALRTPVKDALGLGSAKDGVHHWWVQRLTAVALVPLVLWFAFGLAVNAGGGYEAMHAWVGGPVNAVALIIFIAAAFHHTQLGVQVVLEDYVHHEGLRLISIVVVKFLAVILALAGIFAVLSIALGG